MTQLQAGYWRTRDGLTAFVSGPSPPGWSQFGQWAGWRMDADNVVRLVSWGPEGKCCSSPFEKSDLVEYLGTTLPPDPGEGWRLLRKWPEPELLTDGDQAFERTLGWLAWSSVAHVDYKQCDNAWYRRRIVPTPPMSVQDAQAHNVCRLCGKRVGPDGNANPFVLNYGDEHAHEFCLKALAPTPPVPPEDWELMPEGTEPAVGLKRYDTATNVWRDVLPYMRDVSGQCGQCQRYFVWYARRIETWAPMKRFRGTIHLSDGGAIVVPFTDAERELRCGDETRWEPVQ